MTREGLGYVSMKTGYGQFCPVAVASEIFAERWTPIILRELLLGSRKFNEIHRGVPRMSRALLVKRTGWSACSATRRAHATTRCTKGCRKGSPRAPRSAWRSRATESTERAPTCP
jgi:hypothetical protein